MALTICCIEGCLNAPAEAPLINAIVETVDGLEEVSLRFCLPHRNAIVVVAQDEHNAPSLRPLSHTG